LARHTYSHQARSLLLVKCRYPFIACEVIACEVWGIFESALSNIDMLVKFWEFLDRPAPLNPVQASYFAKVIGVFLMKKTGDVSILLRFSRRKSMDNVYMTQVLIQFPFVKLLFL
jgi:hypothetical protein